MTSIDYFLYDNSTPAQWGRDWGIKAATGALAERTDLRTDFSRYCGAMPSEQGEIHSFREAVGGFRPRIGGGYLLCVTLECSDPFGRPSWAVIGLWCPDTSSLEAALTADPIASARSVLGTNVPPTAVNLRPGATTITPRRIRSAGPSVQPFEAGKTAHDVMALLLGALRTRATLPNVLGITASAKLPALSQAGYNRIYCHPMDDRTERALGRHLSPADVFVEAVVTPAATPMAGSGRPAVRLQPAADSFSLWTFITTVIVALAIGTMVILNDDVFSADIGTEAPRAEAADEKAFTSNALEPRPFPMTPDAMLDEIGKHLPEIKTFDPETLRQSRGFVTAETVNVLPDHDGHRARVRKAYATLFDLRSRILGPEGGYVAYYYEEAGQTLPAALRLTKIQAILGEQSVGTEACSVLREAFGFEFQRAQSVTYRWCTSVERLESALSAARQ